MKLMKKIASVVLAIVMVMTVNVAVVKADEAPTGKKTVYVSAVGDYDGKTVAIAKTPVQIAANESLTEACDKVLAVSGYEYTMSAYGYVDTINGLGTVEIDPANWVYYYWSVYVNGNYANGTEVADGDEISLIYVTDANMNQMETPDFVDDATLNPDTAAVAALELKLKKAQDILAKYVWDNTLKAGELLPGVASAEEIGAIYPAFSVRQAGVEADEYYQKAYENLAKELKETTDFSDISVFNVANYSKMVMMVTALGYDATDVEGVNLVEKLCDKEMVAASSPYLKEPTLLLAMTTGNYAFPEGEAFVTEEEIVNAVAGQVDSAIESSLSWGVDSAAMTIQGLFRYYEANENVKAACDKVITFLEKMQASNGYFGDSFSPNNVWTTAQVMMTMDVFNKSAVSEEAGSDFIKNGKTVIDSMLEFFDLEAGTVSADATSFDPAQILRGINATVRSLNGDKVIFDCVGNAKPQVTPVTPEPENPNPPAPPTGDTSNVMLLVALLGVSAVAFITSKKKTC